MSTTGDLSGVNRSDASCRHQHQHQRPRRQTSHADHGWEGLLNRAYSGLVRKYATAVEGPEWHQQDDAGTTHTDAGTTHTARAALTDMYRVLGGAQSSVAASPISQEFLGQLTVLASDRNQRILDAQPRIPGLLWTGLLFGGVVVVGLGGFMRLDSTRGHLVLLSAVAVLLGLLLFIVYWLDHPFGNQLGVTSAPFEHSLNVFDAIDRGT